MYKYLNASLISLGMMMLVPGINAFGGDQPSQCGLKVKSDLALERMAKWSNQVVVKADSLILNDKELKDRRYNILNDRFKEIGKAALELHRCFRGYYAYFDLGLIDDEELKEVKDQEIDLEAAVKKATEDAIKASRAAGKYNNSTRTKETEEDREKVLALAIDTMKKSYTKVRDEEITKLLADICFFRTGTKGCFVVSTKEEF